MLCFKDFLGVELPCAVTSLNRRPQLAVGCLAFQPRCALVCAKQPVELLITNAACPLNKWEEVPWHNKITRERARNSMQMRFHSHKLPLYHTWSVFTIGSSKYDEERG